MNSLIALTEGQFYASAALLSAVAYAILLQTDPRPSITVGLPIAVIFLIRALSIRFDWGLPSIELEDADSCSTLRREAR